MNNRQNEVIRMIREESDGSPVIHPNGFIQQKLKDGRRMHFWHPEIPRQKTPSPIHDHTFDMASEILLRTLYHREISIAPDRDGYYVVWVAEPVRDAETTLVSTGERVRADHLTEQILDPGATYTFPAFKFHLTRDVVPCVSIIRKTDQHEGQPRVLVPAGSKPDNSFVRDEFDINALSAMMLRVVEEAH